MTQEYEPIEITEDMPEPSDSSDFFITDKYDDYGTTALISEDGWLLPGVAGELSWEEVRDELIGWRIQSLAAHDAEVRANALKPIRDIVKDEPSPCAWHDKPDDIVTCGWKNDIIAIRNILKEES